MKYTFKIPNKNKSTVEVYIAYFTGQHKVFVDGKQIQAIDKYKKLYEIPHSKTTTKKMRLAPKAIDFGLTVFYGDKEIPVAPKLPILDYVFGYLPFGIGVYASALYDPSILGSFIIGLVSLLLSFENIKLFRNKKLGHFTKNGLNILICIASYGIFYLIQYADKLIFK